MCHVSFNKILQKKKRRKSVSERAEITVFMGSKQDKYSEIVENVSHVI